MEILVARQPVFDRRDQFYGYDLVVRHLPGSPAGEANPYRITSWLGIGLDKAAGGRRAFLPVDREMLVGGAAHLLPSDRVILQVGRKPATR